MGELSPIHWLLVGLVAMMLFGANRLPDMARSVGRSLRIFKAEMRGIEQDGGTAVVDGEEQPAADTASPAPASAAPADAMPADAMPAEGEGGPRRPGAQ